MYPSTGDAPGQKQLFVGNHMSVTFAQQYQSVTWDTRDRILGRLRRGKERGSHPRL